MSAVNSSLEFRTCLFRTRDLPLHTDPLAANIDLSQALWCANWEHKNIWDFKSGTMLHPQKIDDFCEMDP
jgi:hypothetical protein